MSTPRTILIPAPAFNHRKLRHNLSIGLDSIKAFCRSAGQDIDIVVFTDDILGKEFSTTPEIGDAMLSLFDPTAYDIVGMSTIGGVFSITLYLAEKIKQHNPNITIVFGGQHSSFLGKETLYDFPFVDAVVIGEGEVTFTEMLQSFKNSSQDWAGLPGVMIRQSPFIRRKFIDSLDDLPMLNYAPELRLKDSMDYTRVESSRGCAQACGFCDTSIFWNRTIRRKSPSRLAAEMRNISNSTDIRKFYMVGDNFTSPIKACREICTNFIQSDLYLEWGCAARISELSRDDLQLMKNAGCFSIFVGVESASQQTLDKINKKIKLDKTIKMIQEAIELGFEIGTSQIIGFPWETEEDILATLQQHSRFYDMGVTSSDLVALMPKTATDGFPGIPIVSDLEQIDKSLPFYCQDSYSTRLIEKYPHQFLQFSYYQTPHLRRSFVLAVVETAQYIKGMKIEEITKERGIQNSL